MQDVDYIYIYIYFKKIKKKSKKIKNPFKKIVIFSNIFLPILHNIGLYIYTVKYKFDIKIPGFLRNISKKNYFHEYGQILKFFQAYLHKKKMHLFHVLKSKIDIITSL